METTKITVRIYSGLLNGFNEDLRCLNFKRDAFINKMIKVETPFLAEELAGLKQSNKARQYVSGKLKRMTTTSINVVVDKSVAEALNEVVDAGNIVRDAFMNRLIMFLRSSDRLLTYLELPSHITGSHFEGYVEPMRTSPIEAMKAVAADPLYYIRTAVEERHGCGIYTLELPEKLDGFTCYLPDNMMPGPEQQKMAEDLIAELMSLDLESLEANAFADKMAGSK
jgi:hypothetical protein